MSEPWVEETRPCPSCDAPAEPEDDGETRFWACTVCGYEFGFLRIQVDASCQLGVPETVRRAATVTARGSTVDLGSVIGRRPQ